LRVVTESSAVIRSVILEVHLREKEARWITMKKLLSIALAAMIISTASAAQTTKQRGGPTSQSLEAMLISYETKGWELVRQKEILSDDAILEQHLIGGDDDIEMPGIGMHEFSRRSLAEHPPLVHPAIAMGHPMPVGDIIVPDDAVAGRIMPLQLNLWLIGHVGGEHWIHLAGRDWGGDESGERRPNRGAHQAASYGGCRPSAGSALTRDCP